MVKKIKTTFTSEETAKIADLSKLKVGKKEENYLAKQFNQTLEVVDDLNKLKTQSTPETSQVTGLKNVFREDVIDPNRSLTQGEALSNSKKTHNGFFVVKAVLNEK